MDARMMFPAGNYINAADFADGREPTLAIASAQLTELTGRNGKTQRKGVIAFQGATKQWVMNRTNTICLIAMFGTDTATWIGKRVTICRDPFKDPVTKEEIGCIRVRGSPDLASDKSVLIQLPRKADFTRVLKRTVAQTNQQAAPQPAANAPTGSPTTPGQFLG